MTDEQPKTQKPTLDELEKSHHQGLNPSQFMRARRPELFSDSTTINRPSLTREVFEYHLDTLTNRKQEIEFEHFCRKLAEKEICPNLIPQTGPTGGGDSKVDTETYPVADAIALGWYEGIGREASQERWAFAFSAKKIWKPKAQSDIQKIVDAKRDYKLIFFITNQFIKDKYRAKVEEELKKKHNIDVRIFDRTWIVKCIFEHDRLHLAAETLSLTGYEDTRKQTGPRDAEREIELRELDQQVSDSNRYNGVEYQLAEDCLQTALLARGLEHPRAEVEGRFYRAERIAEKVGHHQQRLRIAYNRAWTAFWWYDDFAELNRIYINVEELASSSTQATDLEMLANLWTILHTTVKKGKLNLEEAKLDQRTENLKMYLERLAIDNDRPNNALQARTQRLLIELNETIFTGKPPDEVLANFKEVLIASKGLAEFPIRPIKQIIRELGDFLSDSTEYDRLLEALVKITEQRASEGEAGLILLQRGFQKLKSGKKYDAIRFLGRAQQKLAMEEYHKQWIATFAGCSLAYEEAGLFWAARANMLMASNFAFAEYWKYGQLVPETLKYVQKLIWLELQLGRVFYALAWIELASVVAHNLVLNGESKEAFLKERETQDLVLGMLLLKTDLWELKWLDFLPSQLEELKLYGSQVALLYALGYEDYLQSEGIIPASDTTESVANFFAKWLEQPAADDIPDKPELMRNKKVPLRSFVLGCEVIVEVTNSSASIYLAETILSALEALLATSLDGQIIPHRSEFWIDIQLSDFIEGLPEYRTNAADARISVRHASKIQGGTKEEQQAFRSWIIKIVLEITVQIAIVNDLDSFFKQITDEVIFDRAANHADITTAIKNILGQAPKFFLSDWIPESNIKRFPAQRKVPWDHDLKQKTEAKKEKPLWRPGKGDPPDGLVDIDNLKHKNRRVISLINIPLWNEAEWIASVFFLSDDTERIPVLGLGFKNADAGKKIFKDWQNKLSKTDEKEQLRVSIITGIDKKRPWSYNVLVSANPESMRDSESQFILISRIKRLDPPNQRNLNVFIEHFNRAKKYLIMPVQFIPETNPKPFWELGIEKQKLRICPAWQIGENDQDVSALQEGLDPIIPDDIKNAPVIGALQRFEKLKKRKRF